MPRSTSRLLMLGLLALSGCGEAAEEGRLPSRAAAQLGCTVEWVGPRDGGSWTTARHWSSGQLPGPTDRVCIARGHTVAIGDGDHAIDSLLDGGGLTITGGSLTLLSRTFTSQIAVLEISHATMSGPGDVLITLSSWLGPDSTLSGHGTTTLGPLSVSTIGGSPPATPAVPPAPPCNRFRPPAAPECPPKHPSDPAGVRRAWRTFQALVTSPEAGYARRRAGLQAMLAPAACVDASAPVPRLPALRAAACRGTVDALLTSSIAQRWSPRLTQLTLVGDRAFASPDGGATVGFARHGRGWRIARLAGIARPRAPEPAPAAPRPPARSEGRASLIA